MAWRISSALATRPCSVAAFFTAAFLVAAFFAVDFRLAGAFFAADFLAGRFDGPRASRSLSSSIACSSP